MSYSPPNYRASEANLERGDTERCLNCDSLRLDEERLYTCVRHLAHVLTSRVCDDWNLRKKRLAAALEPNAEELLLLKSTTIADLQGLDSSL